MRAEHCADDDLCDYDEEIFEGYIPKTIDPGSTFFIATLIFCFLTLTALAILIAVGNLLDAEKRERLELANANGGEEETDAERVKVNTLHIQNATEGNNPSGATDEKCADEENIQSIVSLESINHESSATSMKQSITAQSARARRRRRRGRRARRMLEEMIIDDSERFSDAKEGQKEIKQTDTFSTEDSDDAKRSGDKHGKSEDNGDSGDSTSSSSGSSSSDESTVIEEYKLDGNLYDNLLDIAEWDPEMKRLFQIGVPFASQALCTGVLDVVTTAVIGRLIGTRELAAFVVVAMCIELTADCIGGLHEALTTLCSQAIGARNNRLAGQYVQLSLLLFLMISFPFAVLWWIYMIPVMLWFGFDEETALIGRDYSRVLIFDVFIVNGIGESIHSLLDVTDHETYSTIVGVTEEALALVGIVIFATFGQPSLTDIGYLEIVLGIFFLAFNVIYITYRGWFRKFYGGMFRSFAFSNTKAVWLMMKTGTSLTLGLLLTEAEWEILSIFASFLGPAEVAAWGVLGTIWSAIEDLIESIADAAEVRAAFLLGSGQFDRARASAYKSILISMYVSVFLTSGLYMCGEDLPSWMTTDPTLQFMIADLLPLTGLGFMALTMGSVCWTLIGAQGRYHLATLFAIIGSCLLTMPLAAVCSIMLNINLQGQTAAIIVGYVISGSANTYLLFRTDWSAASKRIIEENSALDDDDSSSSESSSSCSEAPSASSTKSISKPPINSSSSETESA